MKPDYLFKDYKLIINAPRNPKRPGQPENVFAAMVIPGLVRNDHIGEGTL